MSSSADSLFMEVDGLLANAVESVGHEWILFSNEFEENVLYAHPSEDEELCTSVAKVWTGGSAVASNYMGLRGVSCDDFDSSDFTFFGDHGKLIMQSKWGNDFCITAWLTNDELLPSYVDIGACRDEEGGEDDVVDKALMRSVLSGSFSA